LIVRPHLPSTRERNLMAKRHRVKVDVFTATGQIAAVKTYGIKMFYAV
jgi:hypothetical protein